MKSLILFESGFLKKNDPCVAHHDTGVFLCASLRILWKMSAKYDRICRHYNGDMRNMVNVAEAIVLPSSEVTLAWMTVVWRPLWIALPSTYRVPV